SYRNLGPRVLPSRLEQSNGSPSIWDRLGHAGPGNDKFLVVVIRQRRVSCQVLTKDNGNCPLFTIRIVNCVVTHFRSIGFPRKIIRGMEEIESPGGAVYQDILYLRRNLFDASQRRYLANFNQGPDIEVHTGHVLDSQGDRCQASPGGYGSIVVR